MTTEALRRPSGHAPPEVAPLPGGRELALDPIAREVARRFGHEFRDELERYGAAWWDWCVHDNKHILSWAALSLEEYVDLHAQLAWLARVLGARDYPIERLVRNLEIAAGVLAEREPAVAAALRAGAERVRGAT